MFYVNSLPSQQPYDGGAVRSSPVLPGKELGQSLGLQSQCALDVADRRPFPSLPEKVNAAGRHSQGHPAVKCQCVCGQRKITAQAQDKNFIKSEEVMLEICF